jgi:hypothetical protein
MPTPQVEEKLMLSIIRSYLGSAFVERNVVGVMFVHGRDLGRAL